jgi:stage III sporulation protein AH
MSESLTDTERAQIEDIVTRKTGYDISSVVISLAAGK